MSRLSKHAGSAAPSGAAGGALDGTYPNPGIAASVAGNGLAESADVLSVNVDGSSIEINADTLRVKAGGVTNAMLASPTAGLYKPLLHSWGRATTSAASGTTYGMSSAAADQAWAVAVLGSTGQVMQLFQLVSADYAATGLTPKLMVRARVATSATALTVTVTTGLYPITISASNYAAGTVVSGSTSAIVNAAGNAVTNLGSGDFTLPADGVYGLGYVVSGTPNAGFNVQAQLFVRNV